MEKIKIKEESGEHKAWYKEAEEIQTEDQLELFIDKLMHNYEHDYGTICHSLAAGALATLHVMNRGSQGGITGFQAGAVMWELLLHYGAFGLREGEPAKILKGRDLLFPQSVHRWQGCSENTKKWLTDQARTSLETTPDAHPNVIAHWKKLAEGWCPVPVIDS